MGAAKDFLDQYHNMVVYVAGNTPLNAQIRRYTEGLGVFDERGRYLQAMGKETGLPAWNTPVFNLGGADPGTVNSRDVVKVFMGKGSPDAVQSVLWLAHRYGFIKESAKPVKGALALQDYCDKFVGNDCNGFVGNFIGVDPETHISNYDTVVDPGNPKKRVSARRTDPYAITENDVIITYQISPANYEHIGVLDAFQVIDGMKVQFDFVEWGEKWTIRDWTDKAGPHHADSHYKPNRQETLKADSNGYLYFISDDSNHRRYFCQQPNSLPAEIFH